MGTQGIYAPRGLSTGAPAVVKAAQGGRSGDALCPNVKKNKVLLASPWGRKLPACLQLARTPCTFSPQFHPRAEVVQLPSQWPLQALPPGTAVSASRSLSATLLRSVPMRKPVNREANSGVETRQGLVSAERKCESSIDSLKQQQPKKKVAGVPGRVDTGETEEAQVLVA